MNGDGALLADLADSLEGARTVDDIADVTLRALVGLVGVIRAGLALPEVGGRRLRFLSSEPERLGPPPQWCFIDAYDSLPLNDAVRTGQDIVVETPVAFTRDYPELARQVHNHDVRSVVALALTSGEHRFGGLLIYRDREITAIDSDVVTAVKAVAGEVTEALKAAQGTVAEPLRDTWRSGLRSSEDGQVVWNAHSELPPDATAPGLARRFVGRTLERWQVAQSAIDAAMLCASELVTNVVVHVRRASVITLERHENSVTVAVHQPRGAAAERPIKPLDPSDLFAIAGRGLTLVHALSSRWGSEPTSDGTRVWFQIDIAA